MTNTNAGSRNATRDSETGTRRLRRGINVTATGPRRSLQNGVDPAVVAGHSVFLRRTSELRRRRKPPRRGTETFKNAVPGAAGRSGERQVRNMDTRRIRIQARGTRPEIAKRDAEIAERSAEIAERNQRDRDRSAALFRMAWTWLSSPGHSAFLRRTSGSCVAAGKPLPRRGRARP